DPLVTGVQTCALPIYESRVQAFRLLIRVSSVFIRGRMNLSPEKKIAGVLVPLFALRGENDLGIGDLGALREFIDWTAEIGFTLRSEERRVGKGCSVRV